MALGKDHAYVGGAECLVFKTEWSAVDADYWLAVALMLIQTNCGFSSFVNTQLTMARRSINWIEKY